QKSAALAVEISQATQDQVRGVEGGAVAVQSIASVAVETEKAVVGTRKTMDQMGRVAEALTASLARFKVATRGAIDWGRCAGDGDRQFLLSVFLMEAWDTLAAIEEGLTTLQRSPDATAAVEQLAVLTHRLRGAAALSGFPQLAALAAAMEEAVERVAVTPGGAEPYSLTTLNDMLFALKTSLDHIGETWAEDAETIAQLLMALAPSPPPAPVDETSRRLDELDRFFTEQHDVLEYFLPEAVEHLESMAQSLVALE